MNPRHPARAAWASYAIDPNPTSFKVDGVEWKIGEHAGTHKPGGEWSRDPDDLNEMPEGGITARMLRQIPLGNFVEGVSKMAASQSGANLPAGWASSVTRRAPARPGRAGRDDLYYAVWAQRYVNNLGNRSPIASLAKHYRMKPAGVSHLVHEARFRDLLTKSAPGRAGGVLTDKARALLVKAQASSEVKHKKKGRR